MISYEYPLSERIRTLLRLEDLYERVEHFLPGPGPQEHHVALLSLFEILEVAGRADLKSDLLQELERQKQSLEALRGNPQILEPALDAILRDIDSASTSLFRMAGKVGQETRENEWLMSIKQRAAIPGGVCEFDIPSYHYWLHQDVEQQRRDLEQWFTPYLPIRDAIAIVLKLLRENGKTTVEAAPQGMFQRMMAGRVAQLLCIGLRPEYSCVPEVSANKYALNIRFTTQVGSQRPKMADADVEFELTFCNL